MSMNLIWSHGMDAQPWGAKSKALAEVAQEFGLTLEAPDYTSTKNPDERVAMLAERLNDAGPSILLGSSMGGYVSACASSDADVKGLFLVAPALYLQGYETHVFHRLPELIHVAHGWQDDTVPHENSIRFAKLHGATLHLMKTDHRFTDSSAPLADLFRLFLQKATA